MRSYATKEADYDAKQKITVLCVDLNGCSSLTKGKLYEAVNEAEEYNTNYYQLVNDKGSTELYDKACFVVVGVSPDEAAPIKPPLGLVPRYIYDKQCNDTRIDDLVAAINRYSKAKKPIPIEWFEEVNQRILGGNKC